MHRKILTILIVGVMTLAAITALAGDPVPGLDITIEQIPGGKISTKNYNSSLSNKSTAQINEQVGNVLLRYGAGGAEINKVTDALAGGVYEAELKLFLINIGIGEEGVNEIFTKLDELGTGVSTGEDKLDKIRGEAAVNSGLELVKDSNIFTGDSGEVESTIRKRPGRTKYSNITLERGVFHDTAMNAIRNIRAAVPEERENLREELKVSRGTFKTEILSMSLSIRENAKELRENFREKVESLRERVRIAAAHGKGLRMINRFRSATSRFDHILGRLESRVEKLEVRGIDVSSVTPLIEEAKNMSVVNDAKMEELKAKYESLLEGENPRGIGKEAREIAKELKAEIENLRTKLDEIVDDIRACCTGDDYNSSRSNTR